MKNSTAQHSKMMFVPSGKFGLAASEILVTTFFILVTTFEKISYEIFCHSAKGYPQ